jgi:DNA polymerase-3 subunit epsilon
MILGVLDTETTGLSKHKHRIIEVGIRVIEDRQVQDAHYHQYINPQQMVSPGAFAVHGISNEFLSDKPVFADIADELADFIKNVDQLVIHNAAFDHPFLIMEFARCHGQVQWLEKIAITDTLIMAREMYSGKNDLDSLCSRLGVNNSDRQLHGALKDADILADVYLAMTRTQASMSLALDNQADQLSALDAEIPNIMYDIESTDMASHIKWQEAYPSHRFQEVTDS